MSYAKRTQVSAERSKAEIEKLLTTHGADQYASGWTSGKAVITFRMTDRHIRIEIPMPIHGLAKNKKGWILSQESCAQETRRRWRAMLLYVKSKLESVQSEIVSFEEAFMAHVVLPNRQTVSQFMAPQIQSAYTSGKMPPLLGWDG